MNQALTCDTNTAGRTQTIKFLYSYGGRIVPRSTQARDVTLRYDGGHTRVLSVDRSITFAELMVKFGESCGYSVNLKCKLPYDDLDQLVSIRSDEELKSVIEEYDQVSPEEKIRAVLFPVTVKKISPPSSPMSCFDFPAGHSLWARYPVAVGKPKHRCYDGRSCRHVCFVPQWSYSNFH